MRVIQSLTAAILVMAATAAAHSPPRIVADVTGGKVLGEARESAVLFRGIPFAAPPTGELRWQAPQPVVPWEGIRNAVKPVPACLQNLENGGWNKAAWLHASEDCLTLDVKTPSLEGKRPVMVWIHGGSNRAGFADDLAESSLPSHNVVIVGVRYRLGILGFLSHPALSLEQGGASGNYGLMDQIAALQWVQDNIAQFGGDPANVTIFGESAGSQDVSLLLAAPAAQKLYHKAIMQSGTPGFGMSYRSLAEGEAIGEQLGQLADANGDLGKLRALSPVALFQLQAQLNDPAAHDKSMVFLRTTLDGNILPDAPDALIARTSPKPVIIGTNKIEFGADVSGEALAKEANYWFGANGSKALAQYHAEKADPRRGSIGIRLGSDATFHCPADRFANLLASKGWPVWRYEFDIGIDGGKTRHAYDVKWVFDRKPIGDGAFMQDYWAALAITGDPNGKTAISTSRPLWKRWTLQAPRQLAIGASHTMMEPGAPRAEFCRYASAF